MTQLLESCLRSVFSPTDLTSRLVKTPTSGKVKDYPLIIFMAYW
jgi:hypothetical protein